MDFGYILLLSFGLFGLVALIRKHKLITIDVVSSLVARADFKAKGAGDSYVVYNSDLGCDYIRRQDGKQTLMFKAAFYRGKLEAEFDSDGKLILWKDKKGPKKRTIPIRDCYHHEVWLLENVLGTIQNRILLMEDRGARTA